MDKEQLFSFFRNNYLPREEVLFKLPFSISIENFWPELLDRRKAKAALLPLRNGSGIPYWYTLTDKMITASEKLCEKAMEKEESIDPWKAPMTAAMTEEMFFTSFVEGAQIQFDEAMDFLQSGAEPENIHEQMVWNNRRAWSAMMNSLLRPLDESYIKGLAFLLTAEMDGQAENYRQTDTHTIAVMEDAPYTVPPAFTLPERMQEFYDFLRMPDIHPLLKAAAAQAFILAIRPFPEGNERLSRMVSSAVLLRSGYNFFRDISISSVIAREGYLYYKAMKNIVQTENGGDFTYFMEYYLDLLVRAVYDREERGRQMECDKEDQQRIEQEELLFSERSMARMPLAVSNSTISENHDPPIAEISVDSPPMSFPERIRAVISDSQNPKDAARKTEFLMLFYQQGKTEFSIDDVREATGTNGRTSTRLCYYLLRKGLIRRSKEHRKSIYCLASNKDNAPSKENGWHMVPVGSERSLQDIGEYDGLKCRLMELGGKGATPRDQRISAFLLERLQSKRLSFYYADWSAAYPLGKNVVRADLLHAVSVGLIARNTERGQGSHGYEYVICTSFSEVNGTNIVTNDLTSMQIDYITRLYHHFSDKLFTQKEVSDSLYTDSANISYHLKNLSDRGILYVEKRANTCYYRVLITPESHPACFSKPSETEKEPKEVLTLPAPSGIGYAAASSYAVSARAV